MNKKHQEYFSYLTELINLKNTLNKWAPLIFISLGIITKIILDYPEKKKR